MDYNFHTHTYHCHHACGTPEEYVLRAIENGVTEMGFSDHFPFDFGDGYRNPSRIPIEEAETYLSEVAYLKKKYADRIKLHLGFEMEYYTELFPEMKAKAIEYGAEYLLLGEHYAYPENRADARPHASLTTEDEEFLSFFTDRTVEGMKTGAFTYVAHPDVLHFVGSAEAYTSAARRIAEASLETGVPLEVNFLGIREGRYYPNEAFWKTVGEVGAPVTFGFDAHTTDSAFDEKSIEIAKNFVKKLNLNYIGKPVLRKLF
jgi:histidinol-phosphatase (PHP family)